MKKNICSVIFITLVFASGTTWAQGTDYASLTLSFDNITSTNVDQNVAEGATNEKEVEFGDYDNDGDLDVLVAVGFSDFTERPNKLYRNDGGVLVEVSGGPVISGFSFQDVSRSGFFRDFDQDGDLDIIVINDANSGAGSDNSPGKTKLFRNDGGVFVNDSSKLGGIVGAACNGVADDFDNDGDCDLMLCNYPGPSQDALGFNNSGQLTVVTNTHYPAESFYGVHAEAADMNGDGKLDFLVANRTNSPSFIYYNDNNGAGSGVGDFRYTGSAYQVPDASGGVNENALVPGDFNGDGMMDFYYANAGSAAGSIADLIYVNTGNGGDNKATFATQAISSDFNNSETYKATVGDLDGDGKDDVIVMGNNRRPYIFRNTSANGDVSFIDWTPSIFTSAVDGWHANSADVTGNGRPDILVGAFNNDHLFENKTSSLTDADSLKGGVLPGFHNSAPIAIGGGVGGGDSVTFTANGIPSGARVSILSRSGDDLSLEVLQNGSTVASSSRPGADVDEAIQFVKSGGDSLEIIVSNESAAMILGDADGSGAVDLLDVNGFIAALNSGTYNPILDMNEDGNFDLLDVNGFIDALTNGGGGVLQAPFVIEYLSRTN